MRFRLILPILALLAALPAAAEAKSRYKVGIGEQSAAMFSDPLFTPLGIKRVRVIVEWDWRRVPAHEAEVRDYLARAAGKEVLVHFGAMRGCYDDGRYSKRRYCRAPSPRSYMRSVRAFRRAFPQVRVFGVWNEANHKSQPIYRSPRRAAQYYNAFRKSCRRCKLVAADLLDSSNLIRYTKRFKRYARGKPRIWGLHNYSDVNRKRTRVTRPFLRTVPGQVWLTETGGIVSFGDNFPFSPSRAKSRLSYMFKLADRYSRRRRGMRSKITRIYPYEWVVTEPGERFDAALIGPNGPRPAYSTFKAKLRTRSK